MRKLNHTAVGYAGLIVLVAAAFGLTLRNGFVGFDDGLYITSNPHVQDGFSWASIKWAFTSSVASNWHPVTMLSHMLDCEVFGLRPWGHHLTNLLLHTADALLLFTILRKMTGAPWRSWFVAALFGVHPLRVESVAWAAERKDVLSGLFFFLTLWAYCDYVRESVINNQKSAVSNSMVKGLAAESIGTHHRQRTALFYGLALVLYALGLMSKPMLVTLPFVLLLLDTWPLGRIHPFGIGVECDGTFPGVTSAKPKVDASNSKWLLIEKIPFLVLAAAFSAIAFVVQRETGSTEMVSHLPLGARIVTAFVSYARYLVKLCWPVDLAVFYPHPGHWPMSVIFGSILLLAAITWAAWAGRRRQPYLLTGWFWYLGMLVPVIGLVQIGRQSIADRYTYLPMIGILLGTVWAATEFTKERSLNPRWLITIGLALVLACGALTVRQVGVWNNTERLFRHACEVVPDNYLAHGNLADCLQAQGRVEEAFREIDETLRINPDDVNTRNNFGTVLMQLGRVDEAIGQFQEAIRRQPRFAEAHSNLATAYRNQGRLEAALSEFRAAAQCNPRDFRLQVNLAGVLLKLGRNDEALASLKQAVEIEPDDIALRKDLAGLLANSGRLAEAAAQLREALRLQPDDAEAGQMLEKIGGATR